MSRTMSLQGKTYWLVGASAGIGAALAAELDRRGATLVLSARSEQGLAAVAADLGPNTRVLPMDVTDDASIQAAFDGLGPVDGMIYMAGDYTPMTAQNWDAAQLSRMVDVNFQGATKVLGRIVPDFVQRDQGHIVLIGSLAGFAGLPGAIGYGASKGALMHLGQNLRCDLKETNLRVQLANPGFVRTRLTAKNDFKMPFIQDTAQAARHIADHMASGRFSRSFPGLFSWYFKLRAAWQILRS